MPAININSLPGPDSETSPVSAPTHIITSLSGTDVLPALPHGSISPVSGGALPLGPLGGPGGGPSGGGTGSGAGTGSTSGRFCIPDSPDPYYICDGISEQVLHNYLDKALEMSCLFMYCEYYDPATNSLVGTTPDANGNPLLPTGPGPTYNNALYNPFGSSFMSTPASVITDLTYQLGQDLAMIQDVGAKFVGDTIAFWGAPGVWSSSPVNVEDNNNAIRWCCNSAAYIISYVHNNIDSDIIFNAGIAEVVDGNCNNYYIPEDVWNRFNDIGTFIPGTTFGYYEMLYSINPPSLVLDIEAVYGTEAVDAYHVDITQTMTRMWYYFLATQYIDAGIESLHFGDVFTTDYLDRNNYSLPGGPNAIGSALGYDVGHYYFWDLVSKIRAYAATNARRGVVIISGTAEQDFYFDPPLNWDPPYNTDPPSRSNPVQIYPNWQRQLVFDYHRNKIPYSATPTPNGCSDSPVYYPTYIADTGNPGNPIYTTPATMGLHFQGWCCMQIPILLDYDNAINGDVRGCAALPPTDPGDFDDYNYDTISWFSLQSTANRNRILKYTYYRLKQLTIYAHTKMPGRQVPITGTPTFALSNTITIYRANTGPYTPGLSGFFNQQPTIKGLWNGTFSMPADWVPHNFTTENVPFDLTGIGPVSSLVFVGTDQIYYISEDGWIRGFIKVSGYNYGTWLIVFVNYAASLASGSTPLSDQKRASSANGCLVASPDGSKLFYIGIDNYIHGFDIIAPWNYTYFDMTGVMTAKSLTAVTCLIYPDNGSGCLYFIGIDSAQSSNYLVYGLQNTGSTWEFVNVPEYASTATPILSQEFAVGGLTYSKSWHHDRLYYIGLDGLLYYYELVGSANPYFYVADPVLQSLLAGMQIVNNLAVYFNGSTETRIYCVVFNPTTNFSVICLTEARGPRMSDPSWSFLNLTEYTIPNYITSEYNSYDSNNIPNTDGWIAVSPDGSTIAFFITPTYFYLDTFYQVAIYYFDGVNYYFNLLDEQFPGTDGNSLQFNDNNDIYFINFNDNTIRHIAMEEPIADNPSLNEWPLCTCPPSGCYPGQVLPPPAY